MLRKLIIISIVLICIITSLCAETGWTSEKIMQTSAIHRVVPSPDGQQAVIERGRSVMKERSSYFTTQLYVAPADGSREPKQITRDTHACFAAAWSPDGKWISFLCHLKEGAQLYILPVNGRGEATQLTGMKGGVESYRWAPDSRRIAFAAQEQQEEGEEENAIVVGAGRYPKTSLWIVGLNGNPPSQLTNPSYHVRGIGDFGSDSINFDWSPEGDEITFAYDPHLRVETESTSNLATIRIDNRQIVEWKTPYPHISLPRYAPDGEAIAFLQCDHPRAWALTGSVALKCRKSQEIRELARTENEGGDPGLNPMIGWAGDLFLFCEPVGTRSSLVALPQSGAAPIPLDDGITFFSSVVLNGGKLGLVVQAPDRLPEAYLSDAKNFEPRQVSWFNGWAQEIPTAKTRKVSWKSSGGVVVEGLLTLPSDYQEGERVPLLVVVHGGPIARHSELSIARPGLYPIALFAEAGFAVLQPNPRGSIGYGAEFRRLNYRDWGGNDYRDLMRGIDMLIEQGIADPDRLGIMGWSYGGYMTMWAVSQTNRFQAASAGAGMSDLISFAGTNDIPTFLTDCFGGQLWEQRNLYFQRSPLTHIEKVATPCLIQHGVDDRRVPISQSEEFHRALSGLGVEAKLVVYPRCEHGPREPKQLLDSMERNLEWFKTHILLENIPC